jgi:hypothetical protein
MDFGPIEAVRVAARDENKIIHDRAQFICQASSDQGRHKPAGGRAAARATIAASVRIRHAVRNRFRASISGPTPGTPYNAAVDLLESNLTAARGDKIAYL